MFVGLQRFDPKLPHIPVCIHGLKQEDEVYEKSSAVV